MQRYPPYVNYALLIALLTVLCLQMMNYMHTSSWRKHWGWESRTKAKKRQSRGRYYWL